jgi:phage shock protein C
VLVLIDGDLIKETVKIKYMMKRSKTDRIIGGVCGGIGKYFDINPWAPRLVFLLAGGFWIYVILWIALKEE